MSARDSFDFNTSYEGTGVRVLLVEFHKLAVDDFHQRLKPLSASGLITRMDSTPLAGARWAFDAFRHCVVFIRLREQHMSAGHSPVVEDFLDRLVMSRATVVPITHRRAVIDHFRSHFSRISPIYLGNSFVQDDLLHILGSCALAKHARRKRPAASAFSELGFATA